MGKVREKRAKNGLSPDHKKLRPGSKPKISTQEQDSQSDDFSAGSGSDVIESDGGFESSPTPIKAQPQKHKTEANLTGGSKKKKKRPEAEVKPPSLEEMKELRDTRNLFHSNLFKLQVKEMLQELQLKPKYTTFIETWMDSFKTFTQQLEDGLMDNCKLEVPLNLNGLQHKKPFNFQFIKPEQPPQLIGAASTGCLLGPKLVIDISVEMPASCFQKEDYLNLIYDQKRALYLTYLANQMRLSPIYAADLFSYNYHANNPLKPVLELIPASSVGKRLLLRLFVVAPPLFKLNRFVPWNNNIRPTIFGDEWDPNEAIPATPHYNANVLFDLTMSQNREFLCKAYAGRKNFQEGLLLLKVWLRQRQLDVGFSGFGAHILAAYIVYLNKKRLLHQSSSSYQVVRTVWNQLANSDWTRGITLAEPETPEHAAFTAYYDVCFMDVTGYYNLCANLPLAMYKRVCAEAKLAVDLLNDMKLNSFPLIFLHKCPLYSRMDNILKINKRASVEQLLELHAKPHVKYDYANYAYPQLLRLLTDLLLKGLKKRVHAILPLETAVESWSVNSQAPTIGQSLTLGFILDPEHASEVVEKGPDALDLAAPEFRKFWGEKSTLRRFQDGTIVEAVVWGTSTDSPSKKRLLTRQIVLHLLEHHLQLEANDVQYIAADLDVVYKLNSCFKANKLPVKPPVDQEADAEALTPRFIHYYDELARQLHGLDELPLEIVSISGISPIFRYCEPEPLLPHARTIGNDLYASQVQHVVIQLGQSGKWPKELGALRALKTAFYIKIGELLQTRHRLRTKLSYNGLLVLKAGYCFLLELAHNKELALLKKEVNERGITRYVDSEASRALEQRHYILPKVSGALHALYQTHNAFGPTVLIAKRWLGAQLLDEGLWPGMVTELLVAHMFLQREAPEQTAAPQTGFVRFLQLLAHSDWISELFLLNFNNSWPEQQITELEQNFRSSRDSYPALCLATAYDNQHAGKLWSTQDCPNAQVLARVTLLARHALQLIETNLLSDSFAFIKPAQLFRASNEGYDLVIQIKPDLLPNPLCHDFASPFLPFAAPNFRLPLACKDPLPQIVAQLRSAYADYAAFFYNPYGGKELAIIWKPDEVFAPKPFKVNELQACTPIGDTGKVNVLRETLVADFKFLLKDFYLRVYTMNELKVEQKQSYKRYFNCKTQNGEPMLKKLKTPTDQMTTNLPIDLKKSKKATSLTNGVIKKRN
ncbi:nucleolar protein 6 [Scaptodrosophila lebanonensis]|uniref:Nucleolar protein 6 n=1 Tax=Drosophila lebanonensis TaxID=7225 RepID=A0A6J2TF15_DROLE|nr:nucleolar protein 6 [Scaptodrosophila lebanonensis]